VQTETYDPAAGTWTENTGGDRSLPLFPRLHLIPGGRVYFNSAGQVFNPMGYAYDELTWNLSGFYDPATKTWADGGIPGLGTPAPGFRGSTFSVMLPLEPNDDGVYDKARLLTAGGIIGTSPGTYFAVSDSRIDTVSRDSTDVTSTSTGSLNQPRWYGNGVLTPTGEVIVFSGASADEVAGPGSAMPVTTPELFDGENWHKLAPANQKRTYHNTAALLPDGRILVGGHAPIATMYGAPRTIVPGVTSPGETRNPTFEIYSPPYLFRGDRPVIRATEVNNLTKNLEIALDPAHNRDITSVVLMRRTAITHLIDGGQRAVKLDFTQNGSTVHARMPNDASVLPPGPYLLFVNGDTDKGETPSVAAEITLDDTTVPQSQAVASSAASDREVDRDLRAAGAVPVRAELAYHEIAEMAGHHHASSASTSGGDSGVPWPAWPAGAAITLVAFWAVTGRVPRKLTGTR
jgi:hypothetical protein